MRWRKSQSNSGYYKKEKGKVPKFVFFERTEYKGNKYAVMVKKGIGGSNRTLSYHKKKLSALKRARSYMKKN